MKNLIEFANICKKYDIDPPCLANLIDTIKRLYKYYEYRSSLSKSWRSKIIDSAEKCGFKVDWKNNDPILIDKDGIVVEISNALLPNKQLNVVLYKIGLFYLNKNKFDYEAAEKEIYELRISSVMITDKGNVEITLSRPGLIIGKSGKNIQDLTEFMSMPIKVIENDHDLYEKIIVNRPVGY